MARVYKLQRVEYHSLNKYYEQNISEDQLRLIFNRANLSEDYQHDLLEALADPASDLYQEVWDILRDDEDFNDIINSDEKEEKENKNEIIDEKKIEFINNILEKKIK